MEKRFTQLYKSDLIAHLGNQAEIARKLGRSRSAVCLWGEELPRLVCLELQALFPEVFEAVKRK